MKIYDENNNLVNTERLEKPEQEIAKKYIQKDDVVLELGARYGSVSCIINSKLYDKNNQVVVEPDNRVWDALEKNKKENNCGFNIIKGFIGKKKMDLTNLDCYHGGYGSTFIYNEDTNIQSYTLDEVKKKYNLKFNVLVADCEGFLEVFFDENTDFYKDLRLIIFEEDYPDKCNYDKIKKLLIENNFKLIFKIFDQNVYIKNYNQLLHSQQEEIVNLVKKHAKFTDKNINTNNKWKKMINAVYVIYTNDKMLDLINNQLKYQNFDDIVIYLKTPLLKDLNPKFPIKEFPIHLLGCHISHMLCCEHALENNYDSIIIMEDDCYFNRKITDNEIDKLIELRNKHNPLMINLSPLSEMGHFHYNKFINRSTFDIIRTPSSLTHFINVNKEGLHKMVETKINIPPEKVKYWSPWWSDNERCWYLGGDNFWCAYTDMYSLIVPDKITISSQYIPGRTNGNHNVDTPFFQYRK